MDKIGAGGEKPDSLKYPKVKSEHKKIDFKHGQQINDNYQWLEHIHTSEVHEFVESQNALTTAYLESCPELSKIRSSLLSMSTRRKISCPTEHVGTDSIIFQMNDENESTDSLYIQHGPKGKPKLLLSPKAIPSCFPAPTMSDDDVIPPAPRKMFIRMYDVSRNGHILAYAFSASRDSPWMAIRFKDIISGKDYQDCLLNVFMSDISWTLDGKGILYSCYASAEEVDHKIVFHRLGTPQEDDVVLVEFPNRPTMTMQAQLSDCGHLIFVQGQFHAHHHHRHKHPHPHEASYHHLHFFYGDFSFCTHDDYQSTPLLFHLLEGDGLEIQYVSNHENTVFFRTNFKAPNFKIARINLCTYDKKVNHFWRDVIREDPDRLLDWAVCVHKNYLMVCYLVDSMHKLELHRLSDGVPIYSYNLPIGAITDYFGERQCPRFYFTFSSFATPDCVKYIDLSDHCGPCQLHMWGVRRVKVFDEHLQKSFPGAGAYRLKLLHCENPEDRTSIPIYVAHRKNLRLTGNAPCMIYGQGCFGVQTMPGFSLSKWAFLKGFDGVVAIVGVRGGGEFGEKWYKDGCGLNKQHSYDDFIAAAEYLIRMGYTSPSKLILEGEGYGGNLAGVCLIKRPDLFGAVIIHDGILDMLRFHLLHDSEDFLQEFGDPDENVEHFENLQKLSPLHNIPNKVDSSFPAVFAILGKDQHKLVHPSNTYKFLSALQKTIGGTEVGGGAVKIPCLLRTGLRHMFVKKGNISAIEKSQVHPDALYKILERADIFAFLVKSLGLKYS